MKKRALLALAAAICMVSVPVVTESNALSMSITADAATYGNWGYDVLSNGTVRITSCSNITSELTIPNSVSGRTVSEIGSNFLSGNTVINKVNLPYNLKKIGNGAFRGCSNLSYVEFSNTTTLLDVGYTSFFETPYLDDTNLDNPSTSAVVLGKVLLSYHNTAPAHSVNIQNLGAQAIGSCVFLNKSNITSLNLSGVVKIAEYGVYGCPNLKSISGFGSLTEVNDAAFSSADLAANFKGTDFEEKLVSLKASKLLAQWGITPNNNMTELQKYNMVKNIADKFKSYYTYDLSIPYAEREAATSLIFGRGTCKGISLSFWSLLKQAGFAEDELRGCGNYNHAWNVVKLYNKWYYLDMTSYLSNNNSRFLISSSEFSALDSQATRGFSACFCDKTDGSNIDSGFTFNMCNAVRGDVNDDNIVNNTDVTLLSKYLTNSALYGNLNVANADTNRDTIVDSKDLSLLVEMTK